jgi:signal transduction histidine kinase
MLTFHICEYHLRELNSILLKLDCPDINAVSFPARCGQPPLELRELDLEKQETRKKSQFILGGHCLSKLAAASQSKVNHTFEIKNQCFEFFIQSFFVDQLQEDGGYLLTPGWVETWENNISNWGFDQETAIDFFKNSVKRLILLDTGVFNNSSKKMSCLSQYIDEPYKIIPIDLTYFQLFISQITLSHQLDEMSLAKSEAEKQAADYALIQDTLNQLIKKNTERKIIESYKELIVLLMAPENIYYLSFYNSQPGIRDWDPFKTSDNKRLTQFLNCPEDLILITENRQDFYLKILGTEQIIGLLKVDQLAFPDYLPQYSDIALNISGIFGLAVENIRFVEKLIVTSHIAGKAELATEILHNVGNILNSVNISAEQIMEILSKSSFKNIPRVLDLIKRNADDLSSFLLTDPTGKKLPLYLEKLSEQIIKEHENIHFEVGSQKKKIQLISEIIHSQQSYSKDTKFVDELDPCALIEESILLNSQKIKNSNIIIKKDYKKLPPIITNRSKVLQILANLLINAVDAIVILDNISKEICFRIYPFKNKMIRFEIQDNGAGIQKEQQSMIFRYGFSTKKSGHGFGLHNAANLALELSGYLSVESEGKGKGSTFILTIPQGKKNSIPNTT